MSHRSSVDTDTAWTTGPCLATADQHPLSEDLLRYTPKGGKGEFTVTAAVDVAAEQNEREADRKLKAHSPSREVFLDLVTLEGELKVRNFEKRPVDVIVRVAVPGRPLEATELGRLSIDSTKLALRERAGHVEWRITVAPGETRALVYRYERYVPSN